MEVLNDKSRAPIHKRRSDVNPKIIAFIKDIRKELADIGKKKIKIFLDKYCQENNLKTISESTIRRIIKKNNFFFYKERNHKGKLKRKGYRHKLRKKNYKPTKSGDLVYINAIALYENNIKRYIITAIVQISKMAFAYCYSNLSSKNSTDFLTKLNKAFPFKIERIQTDNGSEFHKYFHEFLSKNNIIHYYSYPREPQQNSYIERFNRTIQEEFLDTYAYDLSNISLLNTNIIKYLIFYNTQRPHLSVKLSTPIDFFIFNNNFFNMYRTHAKT